MSSEFIKNLNEITETMVDGKENHDIVNRVFKELHEDNIVILNACGSFYICFIEDLDDVYQLYPYSINEYKEIVKNTNPIIRIDKVNNNIEEDIIAMNEKEKFYTFTLVKNEENNNQNKLETNEVDSVVLSSVSDYQKVNERQYARNTQTHRHLIRKTPQYYANQNNSNELPGEVMYRRVYHGTRK